MAKEKPKKAADFNIRAIEDRLIKIKNKLGKNDEEGAERMFADFVTFQNSLEKMGKENKDALASLVSEAMTSQIEDLSEVEDEIADKASPKMFSKIKEIKNSIINGQIGVLRSLAEVDPEKAAEVFSDAAESRLNKTKQEVEEKDIKKIEEAIEEFRKYATFGQKISEIAQDTGKDAVAIEQLVTKATTRHLEILNDVYNKVPRQARETVQEAMIVSEIGRQRAVEVLKRKGVLEDIPEEVSIPWEVKEKVIKKADSYKKSCKDLCGDGVCQAIVCMAIGCPCAETPQTCPQDCQKEIKSKVPEKPTTSKPYEPAALPTAPEPYNPGPAFPVP